MDTIDVGFGVGGEFIDVVCSAALKGILYLYSKT